MKKKIMIALGIVLLNPLIIDSDTLGTPPQPFTTATVAANIGVEDVNEWDITLNGTIVKVTGYLGSERSAVKVPSLDSFKIKYPGVTEVQITNAAIRDAVKIKKARSFICDSPTTYVDATMVDLFRGSDIEYVDLSGLDTSKVTNMSGMFGSCPFLTDVNLSNINTSNVRTMYYMFGDCAKLKNVNLSSFNTSNVISMVDMFYNCNNLISMDISHFDTSNMRNMSGAFYGCNKLTSVSLPVTNSFFNGLFECINLKQITIPNGSDLTRANLPEVLDSKKWGTISDNIGYTSSELIGLYGVQNSTPTATYFRGNGNIILDQYSVLKVVGDVLSKDEFLDNIKELTNRAIQDTTISDKQSVEIKYLSQDSTEIPLEQITVNAGIYDVVYNYQGGSETLKLTVIEDQTNIVAHNSILYIGDNWEPQDNFNEAQDRYGNPVNFQDVQVTGDVNISQPGKYKVIYSYGGIQKEVEITVLQNQTSLDVHDSTLYTGDTWTAQDNFDGAKDRAGNPVNFQDVQVTGDVDTSQPGKYKVVYSYGGIQKEVEVTVLQNKNLVTSESIKEVIQHKKEKVVETNKKVSKKLPSTGEKALDLAFVSGIMLFTVASTIAFWRFKKNK